MGICLIKCSNFSIVTDQYIEQMTLCVWMPVHTLQASTQKMSAVTVVVVLLLLLPLPLPLLLFLLLQHPLTPNYHPLLPQALIPNPAPPSNTNRFILNSL